MANNGGEKPKTMRIHDAAVILVTLMLISFGLFFAMQLYALLGHTYKTETAISYTMSDTIQLSGVAVFEGENVAGSGSLGYLAADGERVTEGTVLAERYTDDSQGAKREKLTNLAEAIALLQKSKNSAGSDLSMLTSQTASALYDLLDQLDTADYGAVDSVEQQFLLAQNRLQISTGQAGDFDATLAALQAEYSSLAAELGSLSEIRAETNGYFVCAAKAGFLSADAATIEGATPAEFKTLMDNGMKTQPGELAGRIVTGFSWDFYATCTAEEAARFDGLKSVTISFPGKQDTPLTAAVTSVELDEDNDVAKVRLTCMNINANVLTLSQEKALIALHTYEGIRIDKAALHIWKGDKGVYVKYGNLERFRKIVILYEDENYILAPKGGALETDNEIRLYDEIIVEGKNLGDGKLL